MVLHQNEEGDTTMTNQEKALAAYMQALDTMRANLAELTAHAEDHLGWNPDNINWGHVGSANHVNEKLHEAMCFLGLRIEE